MLKEGMIDGLKSTVAAMNSDNFIARLQLCAAEHFRQPSSWHELSEDDCETLQREVATLPSPI